MAYNPFDFFRRNQKILFAVLTVFIMIMFTLSWGANDFFSWFPRWLGSKSSGEVMAVVDGSKVRTSELDEIRRHRKLANQYMMTGIGVATSKLSESLASVKASLSEAARPTIEKVLRDRNSMIPYMDIDQAQREQLFSGRFPEEELQQRLFFNRMRNMTFLRQELTKFRASTTAKQEDKDASEYALKLMDLDTPRAANGLYFADVRNDERKDAMDFLLWKMKADKLGIRFTRSDVELLIEGEFGDRFDKTDREKVMATVADPRQGSTPSDVYEYIAQEFRVRAAQQAVLGAAFLRAGAPAAISPDQTFAQYKEITGQMRWSAAALDVKFFESKVTGEPTSQEKLDLFKRGQNFEPDAINPRPAFKTPRKLKVAFLELTGKEAYYQTASAEVLTKMEPAVNAGQLLTMPLLGGPLGQVAGLAAVTVPDKLLDGEYARYKDEQAGILARRSVGNDATDVHLWAPENVASFVGLSAASPLAALPQVHGRAQMLDNTHRLGVRLQELVPPLVGLGTFAELGTSAALSDATTVRTLSPKPALDSVRGMLRERLRESQKMNLPLDEIDKLMADTRKALDENKAEPEKGKAAAAALVNNFVVARKLAESGQTGKSERFADQLGVSDDPGLKKLKDRFDKPHSSMGGASAFGRRFFKDVGRATRQGEAPIESDNRAFFVPRTYPEPQMGDLATQSQFFVWLTDEEPAVVPQKVEDVAEKVVAEWKRQKARVLARKEAEKLVAEAARLKPDATLKAEWTGLAGKFGAPPFGQEFDVGANQVLPVGGGYMLMRTPWPPTSQANPLQPGAPLLKNPTLKMLEDLFKARSKPVGTVFSHLNQNEDTVYVTMLLGREDDTALRYAQAVYAPAITSESMNRAAQELPQEFARKARETAMADALLLLRSEFKYTDENPRLLEKQGD